MKGRKQFSSLIHPTSHTPHRITHYPFFSRMSNRRNGPSCSIIIDNALGSRRATSPEPAWHRECNAKSRTEKRKIRHSPGKSWTNQLLGLEQKREASSSSRRDTDGKDHAWNNCLRSRSGRSTQLSKEETPTMASTLKPVAPRNHIFVKDNSHGLPPKPRGNSLIWATVVGKASDSARKLWLWAVGCMVIMTLLYVGEVARAHLQWWVAEMARWTLSACHCCQ